MKTFAEALNGHIEAMRSLDPTRAPLWGIMSAQHMVEHIAETMRLTRTACVDVKPGARLRHTLQYAFFRAYLRTDLRLPRGVAHPLYGHRLLPLVSPDIDSAIGTIGSEMAELEHFFERHQSVRPVHPIFGPMDHQAWILFHRKHTTHHLAQFGLKPRERHR